MKEQLPPPDFDPNPYVRPSQNWICGRSAEGQPCRIGPDARGRCRATSECIPALVVNEGETKGRYRCTRPAEYGGPCETGPLPDGACGRPIPRCQPVRSVRSKRRVFTWAVISGTVVFLLLALYGGNRWRFINPGEISSQHSGAGFVQAYLRLHPGTVQGDPGCAGCHPTAASGPSGWAKAALFTDSGKFRTHTLAFMTTAQMTSIDRACQSCHPGHAFHEPNVVQDHSCSACHREHRGSGLMQAPDNANCITCHGSEGSMQSSLEKGKGLAAAAFDFRPDNGRQLFKAPRPAQGYTRVIRSFAEDHPEFQVKAEKLNDPDTLKFNHKLHLTGATIPPVNGKKLACADCHQPDAAGIYHQKMTFEENCRQCHSLQFDQRNPDLGLPHGNPEFVRAFLRSLPAQYADYAARKKGLTGRTEVDEFVREQMTQIRAQTLSGENLEEQVFFSDAKLGPVGRADGQGRARFPGCVYCHEVKAVENAAPAVTRPVIIDRWLVRGNFNHAKHLTLDCAKCHDVTRSTETADVLLPSKLTCAECHSPKGGVANDCSTCHSYHAPTATLTMRAALPVDQVAASLERIEFLIPKHGEMQSDPFAAAIVSLGPKAGPLLAEKILDDRDSKHFYVFQYKIGDLAHSLLCDIYHQDPSQALIVPKRPVDPSRGYFYQDYVALVSSLEGRRELQSAWKNIIEAQ